jgi:hypothetical protein
VEKDAETWLVKGVSVDKKPGNWFVFEDEHTVPSAHPLLEVKIKKLNVSKFRNFPLLEPVLGKYLNSSKTGFEYEGVALERDANQSIKEDGK